MSSGKTDEMLRSCVVPRSKRRILLVRPTWTTGLPPITRRSRSKARYPSELVPGPSRSDPVLARERDVDLVGIERPILR
jgi:hypothetical protein